MRHQELVDLDLSGVKWEISDVQTNTKNTQIAPAAASNAPGRTMATIVPPIVPAQPMTIQTANAMAARPNDIDSLCRMVGEFNHPLRVTAKNVVLPHVAPNPNGVLIITDMPGASDDESGQILSGPAGELLDKMLGAIGMSRDNVSILPMIFWRTPGGRAPTDNEIDFAYPFVTRFIEMMSPKIIISMGTIATQKIGGVAPSKNYGNVIDAPGGIKMIPIYHPNYLLLKPSAKRDAWNGLQNVQNLLKIG